MVEVATYPPIGARERDAALARILDRLERHDDSRRSEAGSEARDVLDYLRRRAGTLPHAVRSANARDELTLSAWLYWDERRRERDLLTRALRAGTPLAELGAFLGLRSRQGTRDYLDRLEALLAEYQHAQYTPCAAASGDGATDPLRRLLGRSRAQRGADEHATRAARTTAQLRPTRASWITHHHTRIAAAARDLLDRTARLQLCPSSPDQPGSPDVTDLGDYLAWIAEDLHADTVGHGTFASLGLALGELRAHPSVTALPANHGLHQSIRAVDRLRAEYANLTRVS